VNDHTRHRSKVHASGAIGAVDAAVGATRSAASRLLDRFQLTLYKWRLALDPDTQLWVEHVERDLAAGKLHGARTDEDFQRLVKEERSRTS
jgi:hypothetical protein